MAMSEPIQFGPRIQTYTAGRTLPHSIEAEEYLLSCCLLDGEDMVGRCIQAQITAESFHDSKHGIIFECLLDLYQRKVAIDVSVVAEELKQSRQIEPIGGYAFLTQVSSRVPTTAQAGYFIEKVREQAILRETIREAAQLAENCYNYTGNLDEFLVSAKKRIEALGSSRISSRAKGIFSFHLPEENDASILLGNRYLNRGDGGLIIQHCS